MKYKLLFFTLFVCLNSLSLFAQRETDTIKTEKLIVIKQYSPTLNDAFKIKSKPSISDSIKKSQKTVDYSIFSVPVASTFTPVKGTASAIRPQSMPYNYRNYARLGFGNYTNILGQFFGSLDINRNQKLDINFNHLSSAGGIDGVLLDDDFMDTDLDLNFKSTERLFIWNAGINVDYKRYNWYGIDQQNINNVNQIFGTELSEIDPLQNYLGLSAFGGLEFSNSIVRNIDLKFQTFSDDYNSSENQINFGSDLKYNLREGSIDFNFNFNYLSGSFDQSFNQPDIGIDYGFLTTSVQPSYQFETGGLTLDIGLKASLLNNTELSETDIFVYPKINASYKFSEEILFYAGLDGDLNQNSYQNIVEQNPFVSPTLFLQPTDNTLTGFAGLSGKQNALSYNIKAFYKQENDYAFFVENSTAAGFAQFFAQDNFEYSNSFGLLYDDLSTIGLNLEANYAAFDDFNIGLSAQYFNYSVDNLPEASYLPDFKVNLNANYQIGEKWYLHSTLFFVGERESVNYISLPADGIGLGSTTVDSFIDLNFGIDYQLSERLGIFVSGKNLLGDNYEQWRNFNVQGLQVMGGLSYQFDW